MSDDSLFGVPMKPTAPSPSVSGETRRLTELMGFVMQEAKKHHGLSPEAMIAMRELFATASGPLLEHFIDSAYYVAYAESRAPRSMSQSLFTGFQQKLKTAQIVTWLPEVWAQVFDRAVEMVDAQAPVNISRYWNRPAQLWFRSGAPYGLIADWAAKIWQVPNDTKVTALATFPFTMPDTGEMAMAFAIYVDRLKRVPQPGERHEPDTMPHWRFCLIFDQDVPNIVQAQMLAALDFLREKFVRVEPYRRLSNQEKRALQRKRRIQHVADVMTVVLRELTPLESEAAVSNAASGEATDHGERKIGVDFQFPVRGHERNQWYPSLGQYRTIYIQPYKKGNPEATVVKQRERVYRATR